MNEAKVKEVILYLGSLANNKSILVSVQNLYELLWFFEGISYVKTGVKPLRVEFVKHKDTIFSLPAEQVLHNLETNQLVHIQQDQGRRLIVHFSTHPDISTLSSQEIELLNYLFVEYFTSDLNKFDIRNNAYFYDLKEGEVVNPIFVLKHFAIVRPPTKCEMGEIKHIYDLYTRDNNSFIKEIEKELDT